MAPINPDLVNYQNNIESQGLTADTKQPGLIGLTPPLVDLSHLTGMQISSPATYPSYFDLRDLGRVTSVGDQKTAGSCWAYASLASLESTLLPEENWNFSENNVKNLLSRNYTWGFDRDANRGGTHFLSTAYLARWTGPVKEVEDPYDPNGWLSPQDIPESKHVQDVLFIPDMADALDLDNIKWAVYNYGGIYTTMYIDVNLLLPYYNISAHSYYYDGRENRNYGNHAVIIVGWDDSYSKNNFRIIPPGDGAFIVKNSFGAGWGEGGFVYISYYDTYIGTENALFLGEPADNYDNIYQYDPLGWTCPVGYEVSGGGMGYSSDTAWFANVFTADPNPPLREQIAAVSFYTPQVNSEYEIYVFRGPELEASNGIPEVTGHSAEKSGTITAPGYHTIKLDSPIPLASGEEFSIVVKLWTPDYYYPIAVERRITTAEIPDGYSSKATADPGQSYISPDGSDWTDLTDHSGYEEANVCLKAFTEYSAVQVGKLQYSSSAYAVNESDHNATITVVRTDGSSGKVSVQYATTTGTATSNSDYIPASGTLYFGNGETSKSFNVTIVDDNKKEDSETIGLTLSDPSGGAVLGLKEATITINDNDGLQPHIVYGYISYGGTPVNGAIVNGGGASTVTSHNPDTGLDGFYQLNVLKDMTMQVVATYDGKTAMSNNFTTTGDKTRVDLNIIKDSRFNISMKSGWNMISIPLENNTIWASNLSGTGVSSVASYNRTTGSYDMFLVGISPPQYDINLKTDHGYFLYCDRDTWLNVTGKLPAGRSIDIYPDWNMIGWSNMTGSNAQAVCQGLTDHQTIARYNTSKASFDIYLEGISPPEFNFNVVPGEGYFVYSEASAVKKLIF
ncbi:lectin like domain-containing protein [Methanooceanicella nereidis]|nr:lectin like domain-containing protein [Methanocella sp. CWC-04]